MTTLHPLLVGCLLLPAADEKPDALNYLRPGAGKFVTESTVRITSNDDGTVMVSVTERPSEKMTLTLRYDKKNRLSAAELVHEAGKTTKTASLTLDKDRVVVKRGGLSDFYRHKGEPVVTTAPDWCDVFQLVRRYDAARGGEQTFTGFWFHPAKPTQELKFTVERTGKDTVTVKGKEVALDRYKVKLRSGGYLVWADAGRRVCKILPGGDKPTPVMLEGFEEATKDLK